MSGINRQPYQPGFVPAERLRPTTPRWHRRITAAMLVILVVASVIKFGDAHTYGRPGSRNGGVVVAQLGLELWGHPGFFWEVDK